MKYWYNIGFILLLLGLMIIIVVAYLLLLKGSLAFAAILGLFLVFFGFVFVLRAENEEEKGGEE